MKQRIALALIVAVCLALTACAGTQAKKKTRVKCPACGYEFKLPDNP
ncbi:MAG: hypothetical protein Tsb0017_25390 [Geothermobacteraceae bacterium]